MFSITESVVHWSNRSVSDDKFIRQYRKYHRLDDNDLVFQQQQAFSSDEPIIERNSGNTPSVLEIVAGLTIPR